MSVGEIRFESSTYLMRCRFATIFGSYKTHEPMQEILVTYVTCVL